VSLEDLRKRWLSLDGGLEGVLALLALLGVLAVLQTFVLGQHFVIPTVLLMPTAFVAVLAVRGAAGQRWAQGVVLWLGVFAVAHLFFALFWAKTPRALLGEAFLPIYGALLVIFALLTRAYGKRNGLRLLLPETGAP
jgi:hypothetical protein